MQDIYNFENVEKLPNYYIKTFQELSNWVDIANLKVLEIGGSFLPYSLTNEFFKVKQWVAMDFIDWGGAYQKKFLSGEYSDRRNFYKSKDISRISLDQDNIVIDGDANSVLPSFFEYFDVIISVNCFEHVQQLGILFKNIYNSLKKDGILFSRFGPIWSCSVGHHISICPELSFTSADSIIQNHEHLIYNEKEMIKYLLDFGIEKSLADKAVKKIYHSDFINRLTFSDYKELVEKSNFIEKKIWSVLSLDNGKNKDLINHIEESEIYGVGILCKKG